MKTKIVILTLFSFLILNAFAASKIKTGIEVLRDNNFKILQGKRVGLITNPTGVDSQLKSTVDILNEAPGVKLVALYGPEHGVRGDVYAGDKVETTIDKQTGIPVYSLYGKTRKANAEMLKDVDVLVYDIQDIGCRSYTYISTMGLAMEAAAENNIEMVVLDRPNPVGGLKVEGNLAEDKFISFVSQFKIPAVGQGKNYSGVQFYLTDYKKVRLTEIQFYVMQEMAALYPEKKCFGPETEKRYDMFDKVCGSDQIRLLMAKNMKVEDMLPYWRKDEAAFQQLSKKYYLYK